MESYRSLPKSPGVYFFKNSKGGTIYVGKANSLRDRVRSYFQNPSSLLPKTAAMVQEISDIDYVLTQSEIDALLFEANMIRKLRPKYNVNWKDGKSYPLIEITIKDKVPIVRAVHQETNPKALYFGPYPTGSDLQSLLRFLRHLLPFVSQRHAGNIRCLRSHLNLCPCPDVFLNSSARKSYRQTISELTAFLQGQRKKVQKQLTREMLAAAKNNKFEQANLIKKKLEQLNFVTSQRTLPWEYESNPNLVTDRRHLELSELQQLLGLSKLHKIEGYDISNTSGRQATGAQVVFIDGEPEKSLYQRYKIKLNPPTGGSDDFAMIGEVLSRRLKSEVPLPELIVIDGGSGQLTSARQQLQEERPLEGKPKLIGLAKKLETIYLEDGSTIQLPLDSPALHLLQRLRDEAHRFSRRYHRLLRQKNMLA